MASAVSDLNSRQQIDIDIVSDFACPWCLLGQKKLQVALDELDSKFSFNVRWKPFLLRPNTPPEGGPAMPLTSSLEAKIHHVKSACQQVGLELKVRNPIKMPYTLQAHMLLEYVASAVDDCCFDNNRQNILAAALFKGYFIDGRDYDIDFLMEEAKKTGLDTAGLKAYLEDPAAAEEVKEKALSWSQQGISGVPFFFFNGKPTFSGAQEPSVFKQTILKIAEKFPLEASKSHGPNL